MTDPRVFCDRCGSAILEDRSELVATCGPLRRSRPSIDLCATCQDGLISWLKTGEQAKQFELQPAGA